MRDIEIEIKRFEHAMSSSDKLELSKALGSAIELIKELKDEVDSAWTLLDELKASEIQAHSESLKKELDRKISETFSLVKSKVVLA
jgi:hypothetical protein